MRRKRLRRYVDRLSALQRHKLTRDQLLMKLGAARHEAGRAAKLIKVEIATGRARKHARPAWNSGSSATSCARCAGTKAVTCLRTNLETQEPERLWTFYIQLTEVEQAFKELKPDLALRPIFHHSQDRIEAHICVPFLVYCPQVTLKARLRSVAGGITPREVITQFQTMQIVDVCIPTTYRRELVLSHYTQPEVEHRMLHAQLRMTLPQQPPRKITAKQARGKAPADSAM